MGNGRHHDKEQKVEKGRREGGDIWGLGGRAADPQTPSFSSRSFSARRGCQLSAFSGIQPCVLLGRNPDRAAGASGGELYSESAATAAGGLQGTLNGFDASTASSCPWAPQPMP